ncbi:thiamine-phosphate kinase [Pantanalinema sp. GBBB05]|uniref:thiamine-phosphate kinase n=1 Tax=Pantanalinema sp. GBBB05 TaxID=2604139 RepID=UPI001DC4EEAE|nr:thiamine-phosphate kinase [Pantanalinema sp. GBBB05]
MVTPDRPLQVRDIGEPGLLQRLQAFCPAEVIGDDAAVLAVSPGRSLVVTTDVLVDGVHFSDRTTTPEDAGWRAVAANLSDLAAMGASPLGITIGLGLPGDVTVEWVDRLYQGITTCLQPYGTAIVGGDVVRSPVTTISITAFGDVDPHQVIRRSTAKPGDAIVVTGYHGSSRAGLELLLHPEQGQSLTPHDRTALIQTHQRPTPRLDVIPLLFPSSPSSFPSLAIAGMDSSDGLADAIVQICRESQVGARVDRRHLPIAPALQAWVSPEQAIDWALYGGEDFELVLTLPLDQAQRLVSQLGHGAAIVGTTTVELGVWLVDTEGNFPEQALSREPGFQHFEPD